MFLGNLFKGLYKFVCDVALACLWAVAVVAGLLFLLIMFAAAIVSAVIGGLIFAVMVLRDYPTRRATGSGLILKL